MIHFILLFPIVENNNIFRKVLFMYYHNYCNYFFPFTVLVIGYSEVTLVTTYADVIGYFEVMD